MNIPKLKTPATGATKWIAALLGRMDKHLAQVIPALAEAMTPKIKVTAPFHKLPGYVKREHVNKNGRPTKGSRKKALAAARRAANATQPHYVEPRTRKPAQHLKAFGDTAITLTGRRAERDDQYRFLAPNGTWRRPWLSSIDTSQGLS